MGNCRPKKFGGRTLVLPPVTADIPVFCLRTVRCNVVVKRNTEIIEHQAAKILRGRTGQSHASHNHFRRLKESCSDIKFVLHLLSLQTGIVEQNQCKYPAICLCVSIIYYAPGIVKYCQCGIFRILDGGYSKARRFFFRPSRPARDRGVPPNKVLNRSGSNSSILSSSIRAIFLSGASAGNFPGF